MILLLLGLSRRLTSTDEERKVSFLFRLTAFLIS